MDQTLWVFGLGTYNNATAKDLLVWHYYFKNGSRERNHGSEAFHKLVTMCTMAHILYKRSLNQNSTIYSIVDSVCNIISNISKNYPKSRLNNAISKNEEISNLLSSGYSPHLFAQSILADILNTL